MTESLASRQTYRALLKNTIEAASIRNALGDIGNRIGLGSVPFTYAAAAPANKNELLLKPGQLSQPQQQQQPAKQTFEACVKTSSSSSSSWTTTTNTKFTTTSATQQQVQTLIELVPVTTTTTNTSVIMLEVTSDESQEEVEASSEASSIETQEDVDNDDEVLDIDAADADNPQLFAAYVRQIYAYLGELERRYRISAQFLHGKSVTAKMRAVLVDWLIQVHAKFRLLQETMYVCVYLIDAYLERHDVAKTQLQLVGVTALFLACKYEEMYVPAIDDFVYMTDNTYTAAEIRAMEISMCKTLNFAFGKPLPLHFLRRYSKAAENKNMEVHSGYKQAALVTGMVKLSKLVLKTNEVDYKYRATFSKHASSKSMRISIIPELSGERIRELAAQQLTNSS